MKQTIVNRTISDGEVLKTYVFPRKKSVKVLTQLAPLTIFEANVARMNNGINGSDK